MNHKLILGAVFVTCALIFAGCVTTGRIETKQTEPFRVQLEGQPQTVQVKEQDSQPQKVIVENPQKVDNCTVELGVKPSSSGPVVIEVRIEDADTHEVLVTKTIEAGSNSSASPTSGNSTTSPASGNTSGQTVVQNIEVNIKGKNNIVVITQAQQGSADVQVAAKSANKVSG